MSDPPSLTIQFREFCESNYGKLLGFAASQASHHYSARDLLHDALRWAWVKLREDDQRHHHDWLGWVMQKMRWLRKDQGRRHTKSPVMLGNDFAKEEEDDDFVAAAASSDLTPAEKAIQNDHANLVKQALALMENTQQREILELLYFDSAKHPTLLEVAHTLGINPSSIRKLHQRAKESLKAKLRIVAPDIYPPTDKPDHES